MPPELICRRFTSDRPLAQIVIRGIVVTIDSQFRILRSTISAATRQRPLMSTLQKSGWSCPNSPFWRKMEADDPAARRMQITLSQEGAQHQAGLWLAQAQDYLRAALVLRQGDQLR
jgi:hypothetical protein